MVLIRRTAAHVVRATNDAQFRVHILTHHVADPRKAEAQSAGAPGGVSLSIGARTRRKPMMLAVSRNACKRCALVVVKLIMMAS
jgi:hypothetical protein